MPFGTLGVSLVWGPASNVIEPAEYASCLRLFLDRGCTEINMARGYGRGPTQPAADPDGEEMMGAAFSRAGIGAGGPGQQLTVSTKVHPGFHESGTLSFDSVVAQARESLGKLGVGSVDYFLIHQPVTGTGVPLEETLRAADFLHREGCFRRFGVSNFPAHGLMQVYYKCQSLGYVLPSVGEYMYNALTRQVEHEVLPCCRRLGVAFYAYSPIAAGLLGGSPRHSFKSYLGGQNGAAGRACDEAVLQEAAEHIGACAERHGLHMRDVAFRWLCNHSGLQPGDGMISGARSEAELRSILDAIGSGGDGPLPAEVVAAIDHAWEDIVGGPPVYPASEYQDFARL
jgi:aflatoxin B1 aldehyde reductase